MSVGQGLNAVRHPGPVTAAAALDWFTADSPRQGEAGNVIGYLLAPSQAGWFRYTDGTVYGPDTPRDLGPAFELFATTGTAQLRWFHERAGHGHAVFLSEAAATLPPGERLAGTAAHPERRRLEGTAARVLAGRVTESRDGWATLATARYAACAVPLTARPGQEIWALMAEYVVRDEHGNVSVADTLMLSLTARDPRQPASEGHLG